MNDRELFAKLCGKRNINRERLQEKIACWSKRVQEHLEYATGYQQKIHDAEETIRNLDKPEDKLQSEKYERLMKEYDKLCSLQGVQRVDVHDDALHVHTDTIYLTHEGKRYRVGTMCIRVYYQGIVQVQNTSDPRDDGTHLMPHHPHVRSDYSVCWGNLEEAIVQLQGYGEYCTLVSVITQFLQTFKGGRYADYLKKWPVVDSYGNVLYDPRKRP